MSNWHQNLDDKLIRECVRFKINILQILVVVKRLKEAVKLEVVKLKEAYRDKE